MDADLRRRLVEEMAPEVRRLEELLGRDLRAWLPPETAGAVGHGGDRPGAADKPAT